MTEGVLRLHRPPKRLGVLPPEGPLGCGRNCRGENRSKTGPKSVRFEIGTDRFFPVMSKSVGASERPENQPALPEGISVHLSLGRHPGRTLKRELPTPGAPRTEFALQRVPLTPWPYPPRECSGPERPGSLPGSPRANANRGGPAQSRSRTKYTRAGPGCQRFCVYCVTTVLLRQNPADDGLVVPWSRSLVVLAAHSPVVLQLGKLEGPSALANASQPYNLRG